MRGKTHAPSGYRKLSALPALFILCTILSGCAFNPVAMTAQFIKDMYVVESNPDFESYYDFEDDGSDGFDMSENSYVNKGTSLQTIMIYMVGSDLESDYGNASLDLEEMMDSYADTEYNNVVVYTGGASKWQIPELSAEENSILLLDDDGFSIIGTTDAKNMGDAKTLSSFINYCFDTFESESYGLILWDHGGGPVVGFGVDENYHDLLNIEELQEAFDDSVSTTDKKLEWIGFDACLMNSMEVADILAPYANYMIASQETEPGWGWNYDFLSCLTDEAKDGAEMGRIIIDYYMDFGETIFEEYPEYYADLTLSCIDLNHYQNAEDALNTYFRGLNSALNAETFPEVARNRSDVRSFGNYSSDFNYCILDVIHMIQLLSRDSDAYDAVSALEDMVVYNRSNMENAGGISICYPYQTDSDYTDAYMQMQDEIDFAPNYSRFLKDFYAIENGDTLTGDWSVKDAKTEVAATPSDPITLTPGSDISLALTKEQQANFVSGGYYILCNVKGAGYKAEEADPRADEMYLFIQNSNNVTLDSDGVLHAYYNNNVVYMHEPNPTEGHSEYPDIPMILIEKDSTPTEHRYLSHVILQNFGEDFSDWESVVTKLQIVVNEKYPNGIIRSAIPSSDDEENAFHNPSKQLLDLDDYENMSVAAGCRYVTRDKNGNVLPYFDWEESGWYMGFDQDLTVDYELQVLPLQHPENYMCMFYITDAQGNTTFSELIPLK